MRYLGEEDCSIFLAGGEEVSQQEMLHMIQDRSVHREIASSRSGLLTSDGEVVTLGSREVVTSSSRLDSVEALIDNIAESLNQHEQDLPEPQREKIVQILEK